MSDYVLKSPDAASFLQAAQALGYAQSDKDGNLRLIPTGVTQDGGNYFINVIGAVMEPTGATTDGPFGPVPVMAAIPGYWVRIRVNNGRPLPDVPPGFTLYPPPAFNPDGTPVDPTYTQPPYGQIA